jgi:hypothetical protein
MKDEREVIDLHEIIVRPVYEPEECRFQELMKAYHYLGALPKIGDTLWYVVLAEREWMALASFSAAAWKCAVRDKWIGWAFRHQFNRLHLIANNSRFLILPQSHHTNLASRVLSLCQRRIQRDWQDRFGYKVLLLETFVDPTRYRGTIYQASNWKFLGYTKGYRRTRSGYSTSVHEPKKVFVFPLSRTTLKTLSQPLLDDQYQKGVLRMKITAEHMRSLPEFFKGIPDPRRREGKRHKLEVILSLAAAAILCGMRGYKDISNWVKHLGTKARIRFGCRFQDGAYIVPSLSIIRDVLIRVDPAELDQALLRWNTLYGAHDESLAIDGKTMCNAIDDSERQTHIMSVIGHKSAQCYTQKKWVLCP